MHFLQAINSDISVLIVCNKTGGTIKGDIKKRKKNMWSSFEMNFSQCINMPISKTGRTLLGSVSEFPCMPIFLYTLVSYFYLILKRSKFRLQTNPVAARSKLWVCGRSLGGIVGQNPAGAGMSIVSVVCCQVEVSASDRSLVQRSPTECDVSV